MTIRPRVLREFLSGQARFHQTLLDADLGILFLGLPPPLSPHSSRGEGGRQKQDVEIGGDRGINESMRMRRKFRETVTVLIPSRVEFRIR